MRQLLDQQPISYHIISSEGIINFFCTPNTIKVNEPNLALATQQRSVANVGKNDIALSILNSSSSTVGESWPDDENELMISQKSQENIVNSIS